MNKRPTRLNFENIEQIIQFESSRFPFASEERQIAMRKVYRDLEAVFRNSVRDLESDLDEREYTPQSFQIRLERIESSLRKTCDSHTYDLCPEMKESLQSFCLKLNEISERAETITEIEQLPVEAITSGLASIKKSLGVFHKM